MPLDYLLVASTRPSSDRFAELDARLGERTNVARGRAEARHLRPGLFALLIDDGPRPTSLTSSDVDVFDGVALAGGALVSSLLGTRESPAPSSPGNYFLARHAGGDVVVQADPLGTYPVFVHDHLGLTCISNNLFLVEQALERLGVSVPIDLSQASYIVTLGNGAFDLTGFAGVRLLGPGEVVTVDRDNRARYVPGDVCRLLFSDRPYTELINEAARDLTASVEAIAKGPFRHRICDLSGGMDSRLVLAAILHCRAQEGFEFFTSGAPTTPDAVVAAAIRDRFGLRPAGNVLGRGPALGIFESMRYYVGRTSGCFSMTHGPNLGFPITPDIAQIGGSFGELFRGYYSGQYALRARDHQRPGAHALVRLAHSVELKAQRFLTPDALTQHIDRFRDFAARLAGVVEPDDVPDVFYLQNRTRHHFGARWRIGSYTRTIFQPLYSTAAIQASHKLPIAERKRNRVTQDLMQCLCPELADMPYASKSRAPASGTPPPAAPRSAKRSNLARLLADFFAHHATDVGFQRMQPVFDPQKVVDFLRTPVDALESELEVFTAYRLVAAYIWANRLELMPPDFEAAAVSAAEPA